MMHFRPKGFFEKGGVLVLDASSLALTARQALMICLCVILAKEKL